MIIQNHRHQRVALATPVRNGLPSRRTRAKSRVRRAAAVIRKNPLIVVVGIFNAIFYGSVIALLVNL